MKISLMGKNRDSLFVNSSERVQREEVEGLDFNRALSGAARKDFEEDLQKLIEEVDKRAQKLAKTCTLNDLKNYKRAVKNFLERTIKEAFTTEEQSSWGRLGRQKVYVLVKKVDDNLEELSRQVLGEQQDSLNILKKLDEIRGLLIDIYH